MGRGSQGARSCPRPRQHGTLGDLMRLLRSSAVVGVFTLMSRLLGFVREILLAAAIGAGPIADAFFTAFQFPNLFRRVFAEGAFNSAFVPLYAGRMEAEGETEAQRFARDVLSVLATFMLVFVVAAQIAMPWMMYALGPGFVGDPDLFALAVLLTQVTMPYLLMMSVSAMLSGILNSHDRFAAAAAAPVLLNVILIGILFFGEAPPETLVLWLSIGITVSGVVQTLWLWLACRRTGIRLGFRIPRLTPGVRRLIVLGVPGAIAAGVTQINIVVTGSIATLQEGARSWLYYADRLYQLPLGVIGIAMGVALLPTLSKRLRAGDDTGASDAMNRALEISMGLTLPSAVALAVIPHFIITALYQRGAFTALDADMASAALIAFAIGLPAFVLIKVLSPGFFARQDTATPMKFATIGVVVNIALGLGLFFSPVGFVGLAIATAAAGWINAALLGFVLHRRGLLELDARLKSKLVRIVLATAIMGAAVGFLGTQRDLLTGWTGGSTLLALLGVVAVGGVIYAALAVLTGAVRMGELRKALKRG